MRFGFSLSGLALLGVLSLVGGPAAEGQINLRASVDTAGVEADHFSFRAAISTDGRWVAFHSRAANLVTGDTNGEDDVFVHDLYAGVTTRVSLSSGGAQGDGDSRDPAISADGRFVTFRSNATTLVPNDNNGTWDIFIRDRDLDGNGVFDETGGTRTFRVSVGSLGAEADGRAIPRRCRQTVATWPSTARRRISPVWTPTSWTTSSYAIARAGRPCGSA